LSSNLKKYDERDPNELKIELKGAKITRTQKILDKSVSFTDKSKNGVSAEISLRKSEHSLDLIINLIEFVFGQMSVLMDIYTFFIQLKKGREIEKLKEVYYNLLSNSIKTVNEIMFGISSLKEGQSVSISMPSFDSEGLSFGPNEREVQVKIEILLKKESVPVSSNIEFGGQKFKLIDEIKRLLPTRVRAEVFSSFLKEVSKDSLNDLTDNELERLLNQMKEMK
jgi:hypothetical protein